LAADAALVRRSQPGDRRGRQWRRDARRSDRRCAARLASARSTARGGAEVRGLRWRVLLVLSLAAVVPTVVVGVLAILRARHDVENEVKRGALAHIRALGSALDGTLQSSRRTIELSASQWADAPTDAKETELLLSRLRRSVPIVKSVSILDPDGKLLYGDPVPPN